MKLSEDKLKEKLTNFFKDWNGKLVRVDRKLINELVKVVRGDRK